MLGIADVSAPIPTVASSSPATQNVGIVYSNHRVTNICRGLKTWLYKNRFIWMDGDYILPGGRRHQLRLV